MTNSFFIFLTKTIQRIEKRIFNIIWIEGYIIGGDALEKEEFGQPDHSQDDDINQDDPPHIDFIDVGDDAHNHEGPYRPETNDHNGIVDNDSVVRRYILILGLLNIQRINKGAKLRADFWKHREGACHGLCKIRRLCHNDPFLDVLGVGEKKDTNKNSNHGDIHHHV